MDRQVKGLLNQSVSVEKFKGKDGMANISFYDPVVFPCYTAGDMKMVRTTDGREVVSDTALYFDGTEVAYLEREEEEDMEIKIKDLHPSDRITLPDGEQPPIKAVQKFYDEQGILSVLEVNL